MASAEPPDQGQEVSVPVSAPMPPPASYRAESSTSTHRPTVELKADEASQATKMAQNGHNGMPSSPASASSPGSRTMKLKHVSNEFWSPQMKPLRKVVFKILGLSTTLIILVMWACLPFYWGSMWKANRYTNKLTVRVINYDEGAIGSFISSALLNQTNLGYFYTSPSEFPTDEDVANDIVEEGAWGAIVIQQSATSNLLAARQIGNSSYNGTSAVNVYYVQARNEAAVNGYLVPYIQQELGAIVARASAASAAQYLASVAGNATAINLLAQAPTTVSNSVWYTLVNLRPDTQPVAGAILLVGLIYLLIFSFVITLNNSACRDLIGPYLTTRSYLIYRLVVPFSLYLPVSFLYAMVSLPFDVHFGAHYTYAGGFFLWAFTCFLGMAALGLSVEFAITILGPKFIGFFLIPLIIANVSVASLPNELQPWIYRYGVAMPFYNIGQIVRTIIFNTKNEVAMNLGILLAWTVLSMITITIATWLFRRYAVHKTCKELGENRMVEDGPA
ncbi:hypothetical protein EHS25_004596 [Saitozyma podzolica]|uniref:DUF3533 domain-containing protein n=1 Tax=Saitozyma podzolica TaxID=1890683 RepID=A0A427YUH9_9TREE|nr:hypothetical protein EHS25_004596 [Saitozyma podzolica]